MARKISESSADGGRPAVLVVEDEPLIALHLQSILEDNGYNVLGPVGTVDEALRLLAREQPDLAILDANLHGHPVVPVAKHLRSLQIPFILASAYERFDFCHRAVDPVEQCRRKPLQVGGLSGPRGSG